MPDCSITCEAYFVGANTKKGFVSYLDEILSPFECIYIIKGGPGTGKSSFMKKIAKEAEEKGHRVVRYYCSSDPSSLDAITIPSLSLAITDGTFPHVYEGKYIGAKENILNFGMFWNSEFLNKCYNAIKEFSDKKSKAYSSFYKLLYASSVINSEKTELLKSCYNESKAYSAAMRLMRPLGDGKGYSLHHKQISAFGMNGKEELDTYTSLADTKWYISDKRDCAPLFFETLLSVAAKMKLMVYVSFDTNLKPKSIFFPEKSVSVTISNSDVSTERVINTERFLFHNEYVKNRSKIRFLNSYEKELEPMCINECKRIQDSHFSLEDIYAQSMDFLSLNDYTNEIIRKIIP